MSGEGQVTQLLKRWRGGDRAALDALVPLVYAELKRVAEGYLRREQRGGATLQATALVHEAYLKLIGGAEVDWQDRRHFLATAARLMRQILVDHARARDADKRHGGERVTLSSVDPPDPRNAVDLLALDQALSRLEALDARKARVVELRVFAGLELSEIGQLMELSRATLDRDWRAARAWLYRELGGESGAGP
jgi:RNA polymerase sigma factor (TIGR02999 family)